MRECERLALEMIDGPPVGETRELQISLRNELRVADDLCKELGGELRSRQAVAAMVVSWRARNPGLSGTAPTR
jgi:hypothetical protein